MKEREAFSKWFEENSGYDLHRSSKRSFSKLTCCGQEPTGTGQRILYPHPQYGRMEPMQLYRCTSCGRFYVKWQGKYCFIASILRYRILGAEQKEDTQAHPK